MPVLKVLLVTALGLLLAVDHVHVLGTKYQCSKAAKQGHHCIWNLGNLPIIMIPALCKEKGTPFGDANVCHSNGMAYASLSMALGNLFCWSYVTSSGNLV
ncbi:protein PIN-LIKES 3-like isoform X2 [Amaranthus tricolor]|uniref:protein PIN-LIKES 3-like isoform X2 n=1 Tax=Amaranthus tricolor TaxID=29722 RepID=UPI00258C45D4|nr:protein PIN-LIKES 3-like isoform X2 [Amaranthus tricolor]